MTRAATFTRTGHWVAHIRGHYLQRRTRRPVLVWDVRANATGFATRRETEAEVRRSGYRGSLSSVKIERVAQTLPGFLEWRRGENGDD
jgi:hypothetical protein